MPPQSLACAGLPTRCAGKWQYLGVKVSGIYPGPANTEFGQNTGDNPLRRNIKLPGWINMTSEYVARRTVGLAKHPRRTLVIPWWFMLVVALDTLFPALVDWGVKVVFVKRFHQYKCIKWYSIKK